ncbi:MAG: hypothetical protein JW870_14150 [Candidatus Delongbacteria bacterium]|nr:hypothetical protein [Candidatus Delongbacteria bacterium]
MDILKIFGLDKNRTEICLLNLTILFYLFRTAVPIFKYPFLLLYIILILYSFINYRKRIIQVLRVFINHNYLIFILGLILIVSFLLSNKLYLAIFKDVVNLIILLSFFFISTLIISGKKELVYFISNLTYIVVLFALFISILEILRLFDVVSSNSYLSYTDTSSSHQNNSLEYIDSNFALLPSLFGLVGVVFFLSNENSKLKILVYNLLLVVFSFNIILAGSRRGLLAFIVILILILISQFCTFSKKNGFWKRIGFGSRYYLPTIIILVTVFSYLIFNTRTSIKIKTLEFIGSKNLLNTKQKITQNIYKYSLFLGDHCSYNELYSRIWPTIPEDPDSGWGTSVHKTIYPLTGKNVEIVPKGAKGYLLDSTCNNSYYPSIDLSEAYTRVASINVSKGDRIKASVYCFVSDSFNIDQSSIGVTYLDISKNLIFGKVLDSYNLNNKGVWQKLEIDFTCDEGEITINMSITKKYVRDFSSLKGYVIFAYPQYEKIITHSSIISQEVSQKGNNYSKFGNLNFHKFRIPKETKGLTTRWFRCEDGIAYSSWKETGSKNYLMDINSKNDYYQSSLFNLPKFDTLLLVSKPADNDLIRRWVSNFISEDTLYYPYRSNLSVMKISPEFGVDRLSRWEFAAQIFFREYNLKKKIFGGGFSFLNWYGYYFYNDKTRSDWPHNPFLQVLLYSGILGLIVYFFFIYKVFYYYIIYIKEYFLFFIFFLITFFFSFFSAGSPFDPPIMGFFNILPFFIHFIHSKDKQKQH